MYEGKNYLKFSTLTCASTNNNNYYYSTTAQHRKISNQLTAAFSGRVHYFCCVPSTTSRPRVHNTTISHVTHFLSYK